jgi:hypothetical protein
VPSATADPGPIAPDLRRAASPSLRPALLVVGLAALIVVLGAVVALTTGTSGSGLSIGNGGSPVPGTSLRAVPARLLLSRITSGGEPPASIVGSLSLPAGAQYVGKTEADRGVDQFDRSVAFTLAARPSEVESFYRTELRLAKWQMEADGPAAGGFELLGVRNGGDGYQWGVGVVIAGVEPGIAPALGGGGQTAPTSRVELTLYQVGDAS